MNALRIASSDSVAVAVRDITAGEPIVLNPEQETGVRARQAVPFGHKVAIVHVPEGGQVIKYGHPIGRARHDIVPGDHVHVHNLASVRGAARR